MASTNKTKTHNYCVIGVGMLLVHSLTRESVREAVEGPVRVEPALREPHCEAVTKQALALAGHTEPHGGSPHVGIQRVAGPDVALLALWACAHTYNTYMLVTCSNKNNAHETQTPHGARSEQSKTSALMIDPGPLPRGRA